jgi:PAS domain S-box-containing protein
MDLDFAGLAQRANPDALIVVAATGVVRYWDAAAERLFGHRAAEACGQSLRGLLVPPEGHEAFRHLLARALREPRVVETCSYRHKDGSALQLDVTVCALAPKRAPAEHVLFALKDVTALRLGTLAASFASGYGALLDSLPDGILLVAASGRIVHANARALALFGYDANELRGTSVEVLLPQRHRVAHVARRESFFAAAHDPVTNVDIYGLRKNGSEFPIEVRLSAFEGPDGAVAVAAVRDVTERKRSELVLKSRILELEAQLRDGAPIEAGSNSADLA